MATGGGEVPPASKIKLRINEPDPSKGALRIYDGQQPAEQSRPPPPGVFQSGSAPLVPLEQSLSPPDMMPAESTPVSQPPPFALRSTSQLGVSTSSGGRLLFVPRVLQRASKPSCPIMRSSEATSQLQQITGFSSSTVPLSSCAGQPANPAGPSENMPLPPQSSRHFYGMETGLKKPLQMQDTMPAVFFFLVDVSTHAIQNGATKAACRAISLVIPHLPEGPRTMVGIATFDSGIFFCNLKSALQQPFPDIQDVFAPPKSDVVFQLAECRQNLEVLLENIPTLFQNSKHTDSAFGAVILVMKKTGGKLLVFQSIFSSVGSPSAKEAETKSNILSGDNEPHKFIQPVDKTLTTTANKFAECQVCVDLFITTETYVDVAALLIVPRTTGGQVYYCYPSSAHFDPAKLYNDLRWNVTGSQGFKVVTCERCNQVGVSKTSLTKKVAALEAMVENKTKESSALRQRAAEAETLAKKVATLEAIVKNTAEENSALRQRAAETEEQLTEMSILISRVNEEFEACVEYIERLQRQNTDKEATAQNLLDDLDRKEAQLRATKEVCRYLAIG